MNAEWKVICQIDDIPVLGARVVARPGKTDVALFRNGSDQVFALLDRCPHKGGPLSQGIVMEDRVACPMHNWQIQLTDGCAQAPDIGCAQRFAVQLSERAVALDLHELNAPDQPAQQ